MSRRVIAYGVQPPIYRTSPCPTCGHIMPVVSGAYLRYRRQRAGIDQRTFGASLRPPVGGAYISDLERDRRVPPEKIIAAYERLERKT